MTTAADQRLAQLAEELQSVGLESLVMGGHAVRYYGVDRNTIDYDFCTAATSVREVKDRLLRSDILRPAKEGPSWRPEDFARFEVGRLPDGREEWLEVWLHNHLLPDFAQLRSRQERGTYGGREVAFVSLTDLLRSKETERESDWQDIGLLEEVQDARNLSAAVAAAGARSGASLEFFLSRLRCRRGFDRAKSLGLFGDNAVVHAAIGRCEHPVSFAWLLPLAPHAPQPGSLTTRVDESFVQKLRGVAFATPNHVALVEVVRRAYKRWAMEADRRDKQSRLRSP
jgi:hypothetical protein